MVYAHSENDIYINLFIASSLDWKEKGITLQQTTKFPYEEKSSLKLTLKKSQKFGINIRYPGWVNPGTLKVEVNGHAQKVTPGPSSYFSIERQWKTGDVVSIILPMHTTVEYLPDHSSWATFRYGPIVLAASTDSTDMAGLQADGSRMGHVAEGKFYPIEDAPVIVKEQDDLVDHVKPVAGKPMTFSAKDVIYPDKYKDVRLVPFYEIHDARYMLYWRVTTPGDLERFKQTMREKEKELLALEARTVDQVAMGEQQPETEHSFKGETTEMGSTDTDGQRWRSTGGWFSYELKNRDGAGKVLRVTYAGTGRNRKFDILLNDRFFKSVELDSKDEKEFSVDYQIPAEMLDQTGRLTVKFQAHAGASTGRVFYLRLLSIK